ncbi:TolC family protein [Aquisalimonas asiatica]|uniref:Outer membrane protein, cobalt-zinc-cadmium efflux system n=1 Tax=Aquisalimonas asiatica TaxID=406100 RepID=A0A1H8T1T1_9GAMM|nr:TolC family protein [Aquisalimonas asiatica]SEO84950.1 outer membrane protein, cobalt-zinc-cadmium efflux system [Aquisalimonas asiatica]
MHDWLRASTVIGLVGLFCMSAAVAGSGTWTFERAVTHGLSVAPETDALEHRISVQRGSRDQTGRWPNPRLEADVSEGLGREDGRGGYALTELSLTQPLPLWGQLGHGRDAADARVAEAEAMAEVGRLELEAAIGAAFHAWQKTEADYGLAQQRLEEAERLNRIARLREERGDLSERERLRITLFRSEAMRDLEAAEGERAEARAVLASWLDLSPGELGEAPPFDVPALQAADTGPGQDGLHDHPALRAASERQRAAASEISRARAEGRPDVSVRLFRERDVIDGSREGSVGVGIQLELPLWDRNQGRVREYAAERRQVQADARTLHRDLARQISVSTEYLAHLLRELERHREETLAPAHRVRELTYRGYETGEATLLELLEAYNTHFDAVRQEQQLLAESWEEWRELRLGRGQSLVEDTQ